MECNSQKLSNFAPQRPYQGHFRAVQYYLRGGLDPDLFSWVLRTSRQNFLLISREKMDFPKKYQFLPLEALLGLFQGSPMISQGWTRSRSLLMGSKSLQVKFHISIQRKNGFTRVKFPKKTNFHPQRPFQGHFRAVQ